MPKKWVVTARTPGTGSRLTEQRLEQALLILAKAGVRVPPTGRHHTALRVLRSWNESAGPIDLTDLPTLRRIEAAHRAAWELFVITVAVTQRRMRGQSPFTRDKLETMLGGGEVVEGRLTIARDTQFELYIAALLQLMSTEVWLQEPDLHFKYGYEDVGIAAKRVSSTEPKQLRKHVRKAVEQIERSGSRGWIAVNLDSRFRGISLPEPEAPLLTLFDSAFDSLDGALSDYVHNRSLLGVMLFGYTASWHPPVGGTAPRLHVASPVRWMTWADDPGEVLLYNDFMDGWLGRLEQRLKLLVSPDFHGVV